MAVKVQVIFYSMYGHIHRMAEAVAEGARGVEGAEVGVFQAAELVPAEALERSGAAAAQGVRPRPDGEARPARRGRRPDLRHADPLRQHGGAECGTSWTRRAACG